MYLYRKLTFVYRLMSVLFTIIEFTTTKE